MASPTIQDWTESQQNAFLNAPMTFSHGLYATGLFSEERLARLLEAHPDELTDVNLYEAVENGVARVRTGARAGGDGKRLLDAVKAGELWVNLRHTNRDHPEIAAVVDEAFARIRRHRPDFRPTGVHANLLLSGPTARVPYHADTPGVCLFHLVGAKRIWIYPNEGRTLPDAAMEAVALREGAEDLPYQSVFDEDAQVFDLAPGDAVVWPFNAPHRVDNLGTFNVSLSVEFMTWEGRLRHGVYYANGTLRRRFGLSPAPYARTGGPGRLARWALSGLFKRLRLNAARQAVFRPEFDMTAVNKRAERERAPA